MIKNNYLFSTQFLEYLTSQKIKEKELFESFIINAKSLLKNISENEQSFITNILSALQFAYTSLEFSGSNELLKFTYLYDGFLLKHKVSCLCIIPPEICIDSNTKGNFPAFTLIHLLKKKKLEWGILTNGKTWRLYSTLSPLPYENYLEIDFSDNNEKNYKVFWQLFSLQLFIPDKNEVTPLEKYIDESEKEAKVIEDHIKNSIDEILENICFGFLSYAGKDKQELTEEEKKIYFNNAIYLLYRYLFIFYAESRKLLPINNPEYRKNSLNFLLEWAKNETTNPDGTELWDTFRNLCIDIDQGKPQIGIPDYDGGLFDSNVHPFLSDPQNKLTNKYFCVIIYKLGYRIKRKEEIKIKYRDLSVRSLGSLYEGILEYNLYIADEEMVIRGKKIVPATQARRIKKSDRVIEERRPYFSQDANKRHDTGSYFTPEDVVNYMVQNSVRLGLEERWIDFMPTIKKYEREIINAISEDIKTGIKKKFEKLSQEFVNDKILTFKVMDPAMGSGHFLVNSLNTITHFILEVLQAKVIISDGPIKHDKKPVEIDWNIFERVNEDIDLTPSKWRREVVEKCIFGIDINPLSTELAQLSLWIASAAEGKPLTFLNHHLKSGDSIMGVRLKDMLTYPKKNKETKQVSVWDNINQNKIDEIKEKYHHLLSLDSEEMQNVISKKDEYEEIEKDPFLNHLKDIATLWLMISFKVNSTQKQVKLFEKSYELPDENHYFELLDKAQEIENENIWKNELGTELYSKIKKYKNDKKVFHWELEFPEIIENGFESVVGNPPYVDELKNSYKSLSLSTMNTYNLYALMIEKSLSYLKYSDFFTMIVPMASISTSRMSLLQKILSNNCTYLATFSERPGKIFDNAEVRATIIHMLNNNSGKTFSTGIIKWNSLERPALFKKRIKYIDNNCKQYFKGSIPKISENIENFIVEKIFQHKKTIKKHLSDNNDHNSIWYKTVGGRYFKICLPYPPGKPYKNTLVLSTWKKFNFQKIYCNHFFNALINSSLFYWYFSIISGNLRFTSKEILSFPIDYNLVSSTLIQEIVDLSQKLSLDFENKSSITLSPYSQVFYAVKSKNILDEITEKVCKIYNFNNSETGYIKNYDLKYRFYKK